MLSIGKLATGQASYYLQQADARIDRATSVASGVEDYYLGGTEPAGEWAGSGPRTLGLSGRVDPEPLHNVLAGLHPSALEPLRASDRVRVPGFDLTFSAPKSVSVLFGICDDSVRGAIQAGHDAAVDDALSYVERTCGRARRGHNGVNSVAGDGLIAAAFRHRTSRAGDPQLHTHVLIANLVRGIDGRWSALNGRALYAHAKTAGYLYEARLRAELTRRLGVAWTPVRNGIADVVGVPRPVVRAFSRRRQEIEAELARHGASSAAAAQAAALATRRVKDRQVDPRRLVPEWRERSAALGFDEREIVGVFGRSATPRLPVDTLRAVADGLAGQHGLTRHAASFRRREVIQGWCERLPPGADITSARVERFADRFLTTPRAVALIGDPADVQERDAVRYSTPEILAIEQRIVDVAVAGMHERVGIADPSDVIAACTRRAYLSDEQRAMVGRLTTEGGRIVAVVGKAGTGKTTALTAAREAWEASGIPVTGAAVARRAARELEETAGIPSNSLAALLGDLSRAGTCGLSPGIVVVLDEASMVGSRELATLVEHVVAANGKLVLCGDHRQLPSVRAGGAFRAVALRTRAIELTENRRQREAWERKALDELRVGSPPDALRVYEAHGRLVLSDDRVALMQRLVHDWWTADSGERIMIGLRRADVGELNARARTLMRDAGRLGEDVALVCGTFAPGDRVVLRRNDRRLGVANGELGVIRAIGRARTVIVEVSGRLVALSPQYLQSTPQRPALQHAYAVTGHIAQGMTVDRAFVLGSPELYREWGYTAMSRGRQTNRLYVLAPDDLDRREVAPRAHGLETASESLVRGLTTSRAQIPAIDTALSQRIRAAPSGALRRRATTIRAANSTTQQRVELALIAEELGRRDAIERDAGGISERSV